MTVFLISLTFSKSSLSGAYVRSCCSLWSSETGVKEGGDGGTVGTERDVTIAKKSTHSLLLHLPGLWNDNQEATNLIK